MHRPLRASAPPVVIGSHGLLSDGGSPKQIALAQGCAACGIAFFRFDHRGCGESQGLFHRDTSLEARCRDLIDAAASLAARGDTGPSLGLFGSSMGGATCLAAAADVTPRAVVTVAAPVRSRDINAPQASGAGTTTPPAQPGLPRLSFDIARRLTGLSRVMVVHGDADEVVPVENAREIHRRIDAPKKLRIQHGGNHRMSHPRHQQRFAAEAVQWYCRFLLPDGDCADHSASSS